VTTPVYLETGSKRVFAAALEWPGWCRSGRDEEGALEALSAAAPRYAVAAARAGFPLPEGAADELRVVERVPGSASTDFGAPGAIPARDSEPLTVEEAGRLAALLAASWELLDRVAAAAPAELRKGPRGGGRDTEAVVGHVIAAELSYARKRGIKRPGSAAPPARSATPGRWSAGASLSGDPEAVSGLRRAVLEVLARPSGGAPVVERGWPPRYAARRFAWHVLDHAWEIEDRSDLTPPGTPSPSGGRTSAPAPRRSSSA